MAGVRGNVGQLSPRQRDCLRLVYQRLEAKHIAQRLGISESTVETHLRSARTVLGVTRSAEAAALLAEAERNTPDPVGNGPSGMADPTPAGNLAAPDGARETQADPVRRRPIPFGTALRRLLLPSPINDELEVDLSPGTVLALIGVVALLSIAGLVLLGAAIEQIGRLTRG
jgi:DNA-binding CsgD family transcriptional regulator